MDKAGRGKLIVSAAKSLKNFRLGDQNIAAFLYATSTAGRAGLFMSSLRQGKNLSIDRVTSLAACEGFTHPEVTISLLPWFEANGIVRLKRDRKTGQIVSVDSLILTYDGLLAKVSDYYDSLNPRPEDVGTILALEMASACPRLESEILHEVAAAIGEEKARNSVKLARNYKIVAVKAGKGLPEPVFYSERVWARDIGKATRALASLDRSRREAVLELVERVRKYQGIPESLVRAEAKRSGVEPLLEVAIGVGLINRTEIHMADGSTRSFLTSPHLFADLEAGFGEDILDRVKIFLDSIRNGQHYGHRMTGQILDPDALLRKLLNTGVVGPCTAIGTDWVTSEKAGIIRVRRDDVRSGKCYLELVQEDTVARVHQLITTGTVAPRESAMQAAHVREGVTFHSIEETRVETGEVPAPIAEAERGIILTLRES